MSRYAKLISEVFNLKYKKGKKKIMFSRKDLVEVSKKMGFKIPKNIGDIVYSFRYRSNLPQSISSKATRGKQWIIRGEGSANYSFCQVNISKLRIQSDLKPINIPDNTPLIIKSFSGRDEQYMLTRVRYNRLVDLFLGMNCYSLQNHLRTRIDNIGQIEIDEIYFGIDKNGDEYIIPVQAKGGKDKIGFVQIEQDMIFCRQKYPKLMCRPVSIFGINENCLALIEIEITDDELKVIDEIHYCLVQKNSDLALEYRAN